MTENIFIFLGGCEESVNWVVFKNPLAIRVCVCILNIFFPLKHHFQESHLLALQSLKNNLGDNIVNNFRQTQPVNDRFYKAENSAQNNSFECLYFSAKGIMPTNINT